MNNIIIIGNGIFYRYGYYKFQCDECIANKNINKCIKCEKIKLDDVYKKELNKIIDTYLSDVEKINKYSYEEFNENTFGFSSQLNKLLFLSNFKKTLFSLDDCLENRLNEVLPVSYDINENHFLPEIVYLKIKELKEKIDKNKDEKLYYEDLIELNFFHDIDSIKKYIEKIDKKFFIKYYIKKYKIIKDEIILIKYSSDEEKNLDLDPKRYIKLNENFKNKANKYLIYLYSSFVNLSFFNIVNKFHSENKKEFSNSFSNLRIKNWYTLNYIFDDLMTDDLRIHLDFKREKLNYPLNQFLINPKIPIYMTYLHGKFLSNNLGFLKDNYKKYTGWILSDNIDMNYELLSNRFNFGDDIFLFGISPKGENRLINSINEIKNSKNIFISFIEKSDKEKWIKLINKKHKLDFWYANDWEKKAEEYNDKLDERGY
ncbi:MAG: hypothetical protein ACRDCF_00490 [Mycoplasmoidaceae bacterium]